MWNIIKPNSSEKHLIPEEWEENLHGETVKDSEVMSSIFMLGFLSNETNKKVVL